MLKIYRAEELYWQQRCGEQCVLEGDTNTSFFHAITNGRRKCRIEMLETGKGNTTDQTQLKDHIYGYYRSLFGFEARGSIRLKEDFWSCEEQVNDAENELLTRPFPLPEIEVAVKSMKSNTTLGPDGFPVLF